MVATRPGGAPAADGHVPCPVCGGKIHPIAGRCKHCKSDLVALRGQTAIPTAIKAPASAPIPAPAPVVVAPLTGAASAPVPQPAPLAQGTSGPLNASAFAPVATSAMPVAHTLGVPTSGPVAASLPTAYAHPGVIAGSGVSRASQWSRRWPIIVVVLAAAAIVVSIVLLVMPEDASAGSRLRGAPPPTPDHMNTNPIPPQPDPWGMAPPAQPSLPSPGADPDDDDLWGPRGGGLGTGARIPAPTADRFVATLGGTFCRQIAACGGGTFSHDDCDQFGEMLGATFLPGVTTCSNYDRDRASRCLSSISQFPCTTTGQLDTDQMQALISGLPDCMAACMP